MNVTLSPPSPSLQPSNIPSLQRFIPLLRDTNLTVAIIIIVAIGIAVTIGIILIIKVSTILIKKYKDTTDSKAATIYSRKIKILIHGFKFGGLGDYSKQVKVCSILQRAGYECKILGNDSDEIPDKFKTLNAEENILPYRTTEILDFNPDLFILTPFSSMISPAIQELDIPIIGIQEYGYDYNHDQIKKEYPHIQTHQSGMAELGIILNQRYQKKCRHPLDHLLELPQIYKEAIYGNDLEKFKATTDFYFAYAKKFDNLVDFIKAVVDQGTSKKLNFYFMGDNFHLPIFTHFEELGVKSITIKRINAKTQKIETKISFEDIFSNGVEIEIACGVIPNQFVGPLICAAKETYSTGDESFAEIYAYQKTPYLYESLSHKIPLRQQQLHAIFQDLPEYAHFEKEVEDMNNINIYEKKATYKKISALLTAKKDPRVQKALREHVTHVHKNLNFETNFLEIVKQATKNLAQSPKQPRKRYNDYENWPIDTWFPIPDDILTYLHLSQADGKIVLRADKKNAALYNKWQGHIFHLTLNEGLRLWKIEAPDNK